MNIREIDKIISKSISYCEASGFSSYDVFDALNSPLIDKLLKNRLFLRRLAIQINCRIPFNVRPLLGIHKMVHTKALSDLLSIYSFRYKKTLDQAWKIKATAVFTHLLDRKIDVKEGYGWGLNFPYTTRFVDAGANTPNLYNTLNAANAIMDYYELDKSIDISEILDNILGFILKHLGTVKESEYVSWVRYYPDKTGMPAPNVNATSAALFIRINQLLPEEKISTRLISDILGFLYKYQNTNGSWYYTTTEKGKWIDGFHTGFILESLAFIKLGNAGDARVTSMLDKGVHFYTTQMFTKNHIPKYYHSTTYPIEAQNCAQAIQTLARLQAIAGFSLEDLLTGVVANILDDLWDEHGYFYYKKEKTFTDRQCYFRWSQTPMILALLYAGELLN